MTNLAGGSDTLHTEAVTRLLGRTIHPGTTTHGGTEEELSWLVARQGRVTATMARDLVTRGSAARRQIIADSFEPPRPITGNRYIDRGHEREPIIAAWIAERFPIRANTALVAAAENVRHACTPDGIGELDGQLVLAEIKTSKHDLDPTDPNGHFWSTGYLEQMQWQMHVCGARRTLFVWEQHDDGWPNPLPVDLEPRYEWIERDELLIERMIAEADRMLAERDRIVAERNDGESSETPVDLEIESLAIAVLDAREAAKTAEARLKAPWNLLLARLHAVETFSQSTGLAKVTWSTSVTTTRTIDDEAADAAHVEGLDDDVTGADLAQAVLDAEQALRDSDEQRALDDAIARLGEHRRRFEIETSTSTQRLTVTAPKAAKK